MFCFGGIPKAIPKEELQWGLRQSLHHDRAESLPLQEDYFKGQHVLCKKDMAATWQCSITQNLAAILALASWIKAAG